MEDLAYLIELCQRSFAAFDVKSSRHLGSTSKSMTSFGETGTSGRDVVEQTEIEQGWFGTGSESE